MGCGSWSDKDYINYSASVGRSTVTKGGVSFISGDYAAQDIYKSRNLQPELNPFNVVRQCCDTDEHPNTIPVILALDVTGSMGSASVEVAKKLSEVMTKLYDKVQDVEFMIMGIGDLAYDIAPIQVSQFESDIRIAEQLDKVYFEGGGGGNNYESYTVAWYFGVRHTELDCWKRGKKGIIITMGDEPLNPYLPKSPLKAATGDTVQSDIETKALYDEVKEKFDVYHLAVNDSACSYKWYKDEIKSSFGKYLDDEHLFTVSLDNIATAIINIVSNRNDELTENINTDAGISW